VRLPSPPVSALARNRPLWPSPSVQNCAAIEKTEHGYRDIAAHFPTALLDGSPYHPTYTPTCLVPNRLAEDYGRVLEWYWFAVKMLALDLRATAPFAATAPRNSSTRWMPVRANRASMSWPR